MFSFEPSEDQKTLVDTVRKYSARVLRSSYREADESGEPDPAWTKSGWELGLLPASIPDLYGGFGERSAVTGTVAAEELAWGDLSAALLLTAPNLVALPILLCGSPEQKRNLLPQFCLDSWPAATAALMEPHLRFDPGALKTAAVRSDGRYVLNGTKCNVPVAAQSEWILVYAAFEGATQGFLVRRQAAGLVVGEREANMGMKAYPLYSLTLSNCEIPASQRLGEEGGCDFQVVLNAARVGLSAMALGVARAAYEYSLEYAKNRQAFGEAIAQRQAIAFMLAEMIMDLEAARLMVWEAAWRLDQGLNATKEAYIAKLFTDDMVLMVADRAVQILGGHGYIRDHPVELWLRNARGFSVMEGITMV